MANLVLKTVLKSQKAGKWQGKTSQLQLNTVLTVWTVCY